MALINLSAIAELFSDEISVLKKGENSVESGNLIEVNFDETLSCIKAKVLASMKKRSYHVEIVLKDSSPKEFRCECPRGQFKCHHIAAVLIYASKNISKTDVMCQWKAPSIASSSSSSIATVDDIFPKSAFRATDRDADGDDKQYFYEELQVLNRFSGFYWLLSPEVTISLDEVKTFSNILRMSQSDDASALKTNLFEHFKCSNTDILRIAEATTGQNQNALWHQMRLGRLTASSFGIVIRACVRDRYSSSLYSTLLGKQNLDGIRSIQWVITHESTAIKQFETREQKIVMPTGLWLHECGFLGASPDGFVDAEAIIEVKCPYSHRNSSIEDIKNDQKYCLNENGSLKENHPYFHQIQGILYLTNRSKCYFVIWTPSAYISIVIEKDPDWLSNLTILHNFYKEKLLDKLLS